MTNALAVEHLDVLVVGAGLSGVDAGYHLQATCPDASYAIFEARDAIGGTWDIFRYPGIRSDSDMYTLGFPWRPWDGDRAIADGEDIRNYIVDAATDQGIDKKIRFGHRVLAANWSTADGHWKVTAERVDTGEHIELTAGFLFACSGYYRYDRGHVPDFAGIDDFDGEVIHPQFWPADFDGTSKNIVVIGSGATAVTLVPSLVPDAAHVTMLQRSPSYVAAVPYKNPMARGIEKVLPLKWSGPLVRWIAALSSQGFFRFSRRFPNVVRSLLLKGVERELPDGYDIGQHFTPTYDPWDQRLCADPDGQLFKAIGRGDVTVVTDHIDSFIPGGIRLQSGVELAADVVVSATGLELLFLGGMDISVDGVTIDPSLILTYKGMMLEGVPNLAMAVGYTNASWTLKCDLTCDYVARLVRELRRRDMMQATPRNHDRKVTSEPLLGLMAGYVQRSAHLFPLQGSAAPWRVHQSYLKDYRQMKRGDLIDGALELSNPPREDRSRERAKVGDGIRSRPN
ncbi:MAG: monooxygenase [Candidatus Aldehydirespiratoraceae bacterium]